LFRIDAISVGALVRYTHAEKVADVPGLSASRSAASANPFPFGESADP
jgi:hypothetical protein